MSETMTTTAVAPVAPVHSVSSLDDQQHPQASSNNNNKNPVTAAASTQQELAESVATTIVVVDPCAKPTTNKAETKRTLADQNQVAAADKNRVPIMFAYETRVPVKSADEAKVADKDRFSLIKDYLALNKSARPAMMPSTTAKVVADTASKVHVTDVASARDMSAAIVAKLKEAKDTPLAARVLKEAKEAGRKAFKIAAAGTAAAAAKGADSSNKGPFAGLIRRGGEQMLNRLIERSAQMGMHPIHDDGAREAYDKLAAICRDPKVRAACLESRAEAMTKLAASSPTFAVGTDLTAIRRLCEQDRVVITTSSRMGLVRLLTAINWYLTEQQVWSAIVTDKNATFKAINAEREAKGDCPLTASGNLYKDQLDTLAVSPVLGRLAFEFFDLVPQDYIEAARKNDKLVAWSETDQALLVFGFQDLGNGNGLVLREELLLSEFKVPGRQTCMPMTKELAYKMRAEYYVPGIDDRKVSPFVVPAIAPRACSAKPSAEDEVALAIGAPVLKVEAP